MEVDAFFDADLECDDKQQMELPDELGMKEDTEDEVHNIESETEDEFFDCFDTFDIDLEPSFELPYCVAQETDPESLNIFNISPLEQSSHILKYIQYHNMLHMDSTPSWCRRNF